MRNGRRWRIGASIVVAMTTATVLATGTPVMASPTARGADPAVVRVHQGALRGTVDTATDYRVFEGIPYAAPPVGALRWAAPQPAAGWTGTRDATQFGSICPQLSPDGTTVIGDENCLFLNVYTPLGETQAQLADLPVMVWIHGGAWVEGAGSEYDPSVIAAKRDVVVVTINYRIGPLGYLANSAIVAQAPQDGAGAFATLDQEMALRWVRANIGAFGGNSRNVTIFGESGGGFSVCSLLFSPQAAGLFQKAITESGPCGTPNFKTLAAALQTGDQFAQNLGCTGGDAAVAACLRGKTPAQLIEAAPAPTITSGATWEPVIDGVVMPEAPITALRTGHFNHVPVIEGTNLNEATIFVPTFLASLDLSNPADLATYDAVVASIAGPGEVAAINAQYPPSDYASPFYSYSAAATDFDFSCPAYFGDRALSRWVPTNAYEFTDKNPPQIVASPVDLLTYHGSELAYVFQTPASSTSQFTPAQWVLSDQMMAYWTNFARYGTPNGLRLPSWPLFTRSSSQMLNLTSTGPYVFTSFSAEHHCGFWKPIMYPAQ
jgi:para-nitrobenzyl esterase